MIEKTTGYHERHLMVKCFVDESVDLLPMQHYFTEEELSNIKGQPDYDGKYRFLIEVVRIAPSLPLERKTE